MLSIAKFLARLLHQPHQSAECLHAVADALQELIPQVADPASLLRLWLEILSAAEDENSSDRAFGGPAGAGPQISPETRISLLLSVVRAAKERQLFAAEEKGWGFALALTSKALCDFCCDTRAGAQRTAALEALAQLAALHAFPLQHLTRGFEKEIYGRLAAAGTPGSSNAIRRSANFAIGSACARCGECRFRNDSAAATSCETCGNPAVEIVVREAASHRDDANSLCLYVPSHPRTAFSSEHSLDSAPEAGWLLPCLWDPSSRTSALRLLLEAVPLSPELRYACHLPLINYAAYADPSNEESFLLLREVVQACSALAPLKDGAAKKLVRHLRDKQISDGVAGLLSGVSYGDRRAVRVVVRAVMLGPGTAVHKGPQNQTLALVADSTAEEQVPLPALWAEASCLQCLFRRRLTTSVELQRRDKTVLVALSAPGPGLTTPESLPSVLPSLEQFLGARLTLLCDLAERNRALNWAQSSDGLEEPLESLGWAAVALGSAEWGPFRDARCAWRANVTEAAVRLELGGG